MTNRNEQEIRNNSRVKFDDKVLADKIFKRISHLLPGTVDNYNLGGLCEEMRFYKYEKGQKFSAHSDNAHYLSDLNGPKTFYTVLFFLNEEGLIGGETYFPKINGFPLTITPQTGTALLFRHHLIHQGLEVKQGLKYLLKTDLYYTPNK